MPILADVDMGQVILVIVFLVVGFINWLINLWRQKQETAERSRHLPTQEETDASRRAWEEQTTRVETPADTHREPSPAPGSGGGSLKELFEELKRAAQEAQAPSSPPPMPHQEQSPPPPRPVYRPTAPPLPAPPRTHPAPLSAPPLAPPVRAMAESPLQTHTASALRATHAYDAKVPARRNAHLLAELLHTSAGYQQAFILKEILDTPKGIRNTPWDNDSY